MLQKIRNKDKNNQIWEQLAKYPKLQDSRDQNKLKIKRHSIMLKVISAANK